MFLFIICVVFFCLLVIQFLTLCQQFYHAFIFSCNGDDSTPGKFLESTKLILERTVCSFCSLPGSHCRCHKRFNEIVTRHSFVSSFSSGNSLSLEIPFEILRSIHFGNFHCSLRHYTGKQSNSIWPGSHQFSCPQLEVSISSEMVVKEMPKSTFAFLSHRMIQLLLASLGMSRLLVPSSSSPTQTSCFKHDECEVSTTVSSVDAATNRKNRKQMLLERRQKRENDNKTERSDKNNNRSHATESTLIHWKFSNNEVNTFHPDRQDKKLKKMIRNREYARESYNRRKVSFS